MFEIDKCMAVETCNVTLDSGDVLQLFTDAAGLHVELKGNRPNTLAVMPSCYNGGLLIFSN